MEKTLIISIITLIMVMIATLLWGFTTNWGKSFNAEEASRYCYTACVNQDRPKFCTPNLIVKFESSMAEQFGSKWVNTNCNNLLMNKIVEPCPDIRCP